jgi:hypothetical protein
MDKKKKELNRILARKFYDDSDLVRNGTAKAVKLLVNNEIDVSHAEIFIHCLLFESMYNRIEEIRLSDKNVPYTKRSKELLSYFKECATQWWVCWVIDDLGVDYCDLFFNLEFWNDRRKEVETVWNTIEKLKIGVITDWQNEIFSPRRDL